MDRIELTIESGEAGTRTIGIRINGCSLIAMVREIEMPFACAEGRPEIAGDYAGLPTYVATPPSRHLYGDPALTFYASGERVSVLECPCGLPRCWPLLVHIESDDHTVTWRAFEQPHRAPDSRDSHWDLSALGPFTFNRAEYDRAVQALLWN